MSCFPEQRPEAEEFFITSSIEGAVMRIHSRTQCILSNSCSEHLRITYVCPHGITTPQQAAIICKRPPTNQRWTDLERLAATNRKRKQRILILPYAERRYTIVNMYNTYRQGRHQNTDYLNHGAVYERGPVLCIHAEDSK